VTEHQLSLWYDGRVLIGVCCGPPLPLLLEYGRAYVHCSICGTTWDVETMKEINKETAMYDRDGTCSRCGAKIYQGVLCGPCWVIHENNRLRIKENSMPPRQIQGPETEDTYLKNRR